MKDKYKITFCEADTGIVLQENGEHWRNDLNIPMYNPEFDSIEEAYICKDELLQNYPFAEVIISHKDDVQVFHNEGLLNLYREEKKLVSNWENLPFFMKWFRKRPICKIYKNR